MVNRPSEDQPPVRTGRPLPVKTGKDVLFMLATSVVVGDLLVEFLHSLLPIVPVAGVAAASVVGYLRARRRQGE